MCDFIPGRLLVTNRLKDVAAEHVLSEIGENRVPHVKYDGNLLDRLKTMEVSPPKDFGWNVHQLSVPEGEELWKINYLFAMYTGKLLEIQFNDLKNGRQDDPFPLMQFSVDSYLSLPGVKINFKPEHQIYKKMLGVPSNSTGTGKGTTVAIIDTGLDPSCGFNYATASRNFTDDKNITNVEDHNGHGSVVASILKDIAPDCELIVHKVGNRNPVAEWNVLAALLACDGADVVNMSLAFSLSDVSCSVCGRHQSHSSRSTVFQQILEEYLCCRPDTIFVAAAGNRKKPTLDFPARFDCVVATGSLDSKNTRPSYSNYGATGHGGGHHDLLFFAPGGGNGEYVASSVMNGTHTDQEGTSFAAPYASAMIALHRSSTAGSKSRRDVLNHLKANASKSIFNYNYTEFGHGMIQI